MKLRVIGSSSKGNAYALEAENEILLLECGMSFKDVKKAIDFQFLKIKGCLLTHGHKDHLGSIKEYLKAGVPVYTNNETLNDIETAPGWRIQGMPERKAFNIGGFKIIPFYVPHNDTPNFAYLIEHEEMGRLLFATDYEYLPFTFKSWELEHFLIECNYDLQTIDQDMPNWEHVLKGHASLQTCKEVIDKNCTYNLRNVILCHLSKVSGQHDYFINEVQKVAGNTVFVDCAAPEMCWEINKDPF